jgi:hypothetical protein
VSPRLFSIAILAAGVILVALSIAADSLGVGNEPGFGWKQGIGVGVGALLVIYAVARLLVEAGPTDADRDASAYTEATSETTTYSEPPTE